VIPLARPRTTCRRPAGTGQAVASLVLAVLLLLAVAAPAMAHADLVSSDPADKATLATPPTSVTLTFSEDLDPARSSFRLSGPAGVIGTGAVSAVPTQLTLAGLDLAPGDYEIRWTSAALDGDILRGTLTFTVAEPTPAPATPTPEPRVTPAPTASPAEAPSGVATPAPTPAPSAAPQPASSTVDVLLPIVAALVIVAGVGLYVLRRSRRA
jgi:methionine-rich copper-binding protein CopC